MPAFPEDGELPPLPAVALNASKIIGESRAAERSRSFDVAGAVTPAAGLVLLIFSLARGTADPARPGSQGGPLVPGGRHLGRAAFLPAGPRDLGGADGRAGPPSAGFDLAAAWRSLATRLEDRPLAATVTAHADQDQVVGPPRARTHLTRLGHELMARYGALHEVASP